MTDGRPGSRLILDVLAYMAARLALVVVLTAVIVGAGRLLGVRDVPVVVALLFAIVIALPLGIWVFTPLRRRATASIAALDARRRSDREQLQARLRGENPPDATGGRERSDSGNVSGGRERSDSGNVSGGRERSDSGHISVEDDVDSKGA